MYGKNAVKIDRVGRVDRANINIAKTERAKIDEVKVDRLKVNCVHAKVNCNRVKVDNNVGKADRAKVDGVLGREFSDIFMIRTSEDVLNVYVVPGFHIFLKDVLCDSSDDDLKHASSDGSEVGPGEGSRAGSDESSGAVPENGYGSDARTADSRGLGCCVCEDTEDYWEDAESRRDNRDSRNSRNSRCNKRNSGTIATSIKLEHKFTYDVLFKSLFVKNPDLLKSFVAALLHIPFEGIKQFEIRNSEIPPDWFDKKFCRLDINLEVNGQRIDIEVQVRDEGDYRERSLFYWAREFSSAIDRGQTYVKLPKTVVINILNFPLFECEEFYSEFRAIEVSRHEPLTDRMSMQYYELPKVSTVFDTLDIADTSDIADTLDIADTSDTSRRMLAASNTPKNASNTFKGDDLLRLWLALFKAETEQDLEDIKKLGVPEVNQTIEAYWIVAASPEFRESARLHEKALHAEASALHHAEEVGEKRGIKKGRAEGKKLEREKWQGVVAEKDAAIAEKEVEKEAAIAEKEAEKEAAIAEKDAIIAELMARL